MEVSIPLAHIFNLSISQGVFPDALKVSRIVPIFKSGSADLCDNYRLIALLNTLTNSQHLTDHNLLHDGQFGFQGKTLNKTSYTQSHQLATASTMENTASGYSRSKKSI